MPVLALLLRPFLLVRPFPLHRTMWPFLLLLWPHRVPRLLPVLVLAIAPAAAAAAAAGIASSVTASPCATVVVGLRGTLAATGGPGGASLWCAASALRAWASALRALAPVRHGGACGSPSKMMRRGSAAGRLRECNSDSNRLAAAARQTGQTELHRLVLLDRTVQRGPARQGPKRTI